MFQSTAHWKIFSYPFNYAVVEDAFPEPLTCELDVVFRELIPSAKKIGKVGEVGELTYDALNFTPSLRHVQSTAIGCFASDELQNFVAQLFDIELDGNIMIGMHRHQAPSKPGWPHTDFAVVSFPNEPPNCGRFRVYYDGCGCNYSDDSRDRQPDSIKTARALACLYYTCNSDWQATLGGETGIFAELGQSLVARVPPKNNSLLIFEISPLSYHAYLGSPHVERNCYIWWYHADPAYLLARHQQAVEYKRDLQLDAWDRWTDADVAKYQPELAAS